MKSTVVDESLSSFKPMYCSREYHTSTRLNQQYEKSTLNYTPNLAPVTTDIGVVATRTPTEVIPGHSTDPLTTVYHITGALVPTTTTATHLTADPHLIGR